MAVQGIRSPEEFHSIILKDGRNNASCSEKIGCRPVDCTRCVAATKKRVRLLVK